VFYGALFLPPPHGQPIIYQLRSPQKRAGRQSAVLCLCFNEIKLLAELRINPPLTNGC